MPADRASKVVQRLIAPDMWSGWGIRTLSADHPAYNPFSYQNGSVWPHDNSLIALGFRRYGFAAEAMRVVHDVSRAGSYFMQHQMPELYAGRQRDVMSFPVQYLGTNVGGRLGISLSPGDPWSSPGREGGLEDQRAAPISPVGNFRRRLRGYLPSTVLRLAEQRAKTAF